MVVASSLAQKKITPPSIGTFSTDSLLFIILLISVILILGALAFFPAISLGPIVEHFLMIKAYRFNHRRYMKSKHQQLFDVYIILNAIKRPFRMLAPQTQFKNPVMFVTYFGAILTTLHVRKRFNQRLFIWV